MPDGAPRLLSLSVLGGALHGQKIELDAVDDVSIGSDPGCRFHVDLPTVSPIHARLWVDLGGAVVHDTRSPAGVFVNLDRVEGQSPLREGDVIWLGPPQAPGSVLIQCRFAEAETEAAEAPESAPPRAGASSEGGPTAEPAVTGFDDFFADQPAPSPVAGAPSEDDPFFIAEAPPPAPAAPSAPAAEGEPVAFTADEFFAEPAPTAVTAAAPIELPSLELPDAPVAPAPSAAPAGPAEASPGPQSKAEAAARRPGPGAPAATSGPPPAPVAAPRPTAARPAIAASAPDRSPTAATVRRPESSRAIRPAARSGRAPAAARRPPASPRPRTLAIGAGGLALLAGLAWVATRFLGSAEVVSIEPARARTGQTVTLIGTGFATDPQGNVVLFGDKAGTVVKATEGRLEVVVPDVVTAPGRDVRLPVLVRVGRAESRPVELSVFAGPTLHGISPDVAMPGDEVMLAGAGWGPGSTVRFGPQAAEVLDVRDTSMRVRVPPILGGPGTSAPVVVSAGSSDSNSAPFFVGRVPLVLQTDPPAAAIGEVVAIRGRGFPRDPLRNAVHIAGARALIVSVSDDELRVVVPRVPTAPDEARPIEVRVAGSPNVGRSTIQVASPPSTVDFRFVAEPFDAAYGRSHAVLATGLGPAFVLAAAKGSAAAARAVEAQRRLNDAAALLRATPGLNIEVQTPDTTPVLALAGRPEILLEVTEEDAAAYNEDWTGLRGRGGAVTRTRLARWWTAVASDLVLMLVRGERPRFAAALAPEGRVLADVFQAGRKTGDAGLSLAAVAVLRPATREALRVLAFRVPSGVPGPAAPASAAVAPAAREAPPLRLEGVWVGSEREGGLRRELTATFRTGSGSVGYEGLVTLTVPLLSLEQPEKDAVRFSLQYRGGIRYYSGRWDGQTLAGTVARDPAGSDTVATFSLRPR